MFQLLLVLNFSAVSSSFLSSLSYPFCTLLPINLVILAIFTKTPKTVAIILDQKSHFCLDRFVGMFFSYGCGVTIIILCMCMTWNIQLMHGTQCVFSKPMQDKDDNTALIKACRRGHIEAARILLDNRANVDHQNKVSSRT